MKWNSEEFGGFKAPDTWTLNTNNLIIRLSKVKDSWYLTCSQLGIFVQSLGDMNTKDAQQKAMNIMIERVEQDLSDLKKVK